MSDEMLVNKAQGIKPHIPLVHLAEQLSPTPLSAAHNDPQPAQ